MHAFIWENVRINAHSVEFKILIITNAQIFITDSQYVIFDFVNEIWITILLTY